MLKCFVEKNLFSLFFSPILSLLSCKSSPRLYVGNLSWNIRWQELKEYMKRAGNVIKADVMEEPSGRSKGCGIVTFATMEEAQHAVNTLNNTELDGTSTMIIYKFGCIILL